MEGLKAIPYIILVLAVAGIVSGATAIVLGKFQDTTTNADAIRAIQNASAANVDVAEQLPTVAIIGIMVIVISLIAGIFAYVKLFA